MPTETLIFTIIKYNHYFKSIAKIHLSLLYCLYLKKIGRFEFKNKTSTLARTKLTHKIIYYLFPLFDHNKKRRQIKKRKKLFIPVTRRVKGYTRSIKYIYS